MKTRNSIIAGIWVAVVALIWSCNETDETPFIDQENIVLENLLVNSNSALNRLRSTGIGGPMGAIFGNFQSRNGRTDSSPLKMMSRGKVADDSVGVEKPKCLVETWEDDGVGNYTYTIDFGDGCDYYGEFLKGKMVEKGSYTENSFSSIVAYTKFGGQDWMIDGTHNYSGTWEEVTINGISMPADTVDTDSLDYQDYYYNASYEFSADLTTSYMEYGYDTTSEVSTGERLVEVDYIAQGSEEVDQNGYTVKSRSESVTINTGESFQAQVDIPLFYDFNCEDEGVWIFVNGKESGSYTVDDQTGTYSIDYGDGSCDNIVMVTENGISGEVDLGEIWDSWEEECGTEG